MVAPRIVLSLVCIAAPTVFADTIVQPFFGVNAAATYSNTSSTGSFQTVTPIDFSQFDPLLGTLNSVTLTITSSGTSGDGVTPLSMTQTVRSGGRRTLGPAAQSYLVTGRTEAVLNIPGLAPQTYFTAGSSSATCNVTAGGSQVKNCAPATVTTLTSLNPTSPAVYSPLVLAPYIGTGLVTVNYNLTAFMTALTRTGSGNGIFTTASVAGSNVFDAVLTYDYTPAAVPEPSTLGAFAIAGIAGLLIQRRRRS